MGPLLMYEDNKVSDESKENRHKTLKEYYKKLDTSQPNNKKRKTVKNIDKNSRIHFDSEQPGKKLSLNEDFVYFNVTVEG